MKLFANNRAFYICGFCILSRREPEVDFVLTQNSFFFLWKLCLKIRS